MRWYDEYSMKKINTDLYEYLQQTKHSDKDTYTQTVWAHTKKNNKNKHTEVPSDTLRNKENPTTLRHCFV